MLAQGQISDASAEGGSALARSPDVWMQIRGLTKSFAGELALDEANLDIKKGEVHGLVGANGAGKSTLIRCLAGVTLADRGRITIDGAELPQGSPQASEQAGLAFIHQELNLVPHFSALQNMLLGVPKANRFGLIDWRRSSTRARAAAERIGVHFPLETRASDLSVAERWLVIIGKALMRDASMIAMDEPTASLSGPESDKLFAIIRDLSRDGVAILYVSHRLEEVLDLCDRITVLRDGRIVDDAVRGRLDKKGLVRAIIGHDIRSPEDRERFTADRSGKPVFSVRDVTWRGAVKGVSFDVYPGEVLALGGLVGAGRTELAHLAAGVERPDAGHFELDGTRLDIANEAEAVAAGIGIVPEERRSQGLMLQQSVGFNINIASLANLRTVPALPFVSAGKGRRRADGLVDKLGIKTSSSATKIASLSGGNQQKTLIARWLRPGIRLLILDEPSRGVDVGAREEIHDTIRSLARSGVGIIVISSDVEELAALADRVVVMREGHLTGELTGTDITEARIIELSYHDADGGGGEQGLTTRSEAAAGTTLGRNRIDWKRLGLTFLSRYATIFGLLLMILVFSIMAPDTFFSRANFLNILSQASLTAIIAAGLTYTLVVGEFDLSVGFVASFIGLIVVGFMSYQGLPIWLSIAAALAIGVCLGLINGALVTKVRINAVISTLGLGTMLTGIGFSYSAFPIATGIPRAFTNLSLGRVLFGIPNPVFFMLGILLVLWVTLNKTDIGQKMQAVGSNIEAARLSGIRVDRIKMFAFATAGLCAAITGTLLSSLLGSGTLGVGDGYLLDAFAAVFLGSATLREGEFHIVGTFVGVLILAVGFNGLAILGAPTHFQPIFKGGILILAVGVSALARRYAASR
jgi:ribose transport system ATP-binding protein